MPTQRFAPMTKDFPTFDCDAHVVEPALIWEMAAENLPKDEIEALKATMWYDAPNNQVIVNGKTDVSNFYPIPDVGPGKVDIVRLAGPGMKHNIQRAINVRNVNPETAITAEQSRYLAHDGAGEPGPRLRDMDTQGIDQVMLIPSDIDTYPWLQNALGAKAMCKAYNNWAYNYTLEDPERLFFAALLPMQSPTYAVEELYRVAELGCRVALIRPMDAQGNYPVQPKYEPLWKAMEDTGVVYGMHPFPAFGNAKPRGLHRAILRCRTDPPHHDHFRAAPPFPSQRPELSGRGRPLGHAGPDDRLLREASQDQRRRVRGVLHLAEFPPRRVRQDLHPLPQRAKTPGPQAPPQRDLLPALCHRFRRRRSPAVAPPRLLQGHPRLVLRRVSPRRRRRLGGHRDDGRV